MGIGLIISLSGCSKPNTAENTTPSPVDYNVYTQYSYRGPGSPSDTTFYYYTTSKTAFDSLFYFIYDHNIPDTIPQADLSNKKVISIVKYGNDFYVLSVKGLSLLDGIITVDYSDSLVSENMTWTTAIPSIITTSADFQKIKLVENGITVKIIYP